MFISGHIEIVKEVLDEYFDGDYFAGLKNYKKVNKKLLLRGLEIVDLPCQKYKVDHINKSIILRKHNVCKVHKMLNLFHDMTTGENAIFQFHRGYFSHHHSMSTDPENSVLKIRNKIIMSVLGYCLLSVYDQTVFFEKPSFSPNSIWIGYIMHILTDSYSPAHTIRLNSNKTKTFSQAKTVDAKTSDKLYIHEKIKSLSKQRDVIYETKKQFIEKLVSISEPRFEKIINKNAKTYWKMYKVFKFDYDVNHLIEYWSNEIIRTQGLSSERNVENEYDIINFQHYSSQPFMSHFKYDFLDRVRRIPKMYMRMKKECFDFLVLYKTVLRTKDIEAFLRGVLIFLLNGPFHIHKKYWYNMTDMYQT